MNTAKNENTLAEDYRIQIINSFDEASMYRQIWNNLVLSSENPNPFLIFEWFESWWQCFASKDKTPYIIFIWKAQELIGIAPLMLVQIKKFGFKINKLEFLSMMKYAYSALNLAGHLDFIIRRDNHKIALECILKHLKEKVKNWDYIRLHPILSDSQTLKSLRDNKKYYKFDIYIRRVFFSTKIVFDSTWENYLTKLDRDFVKKINRRENKLKKIGKFEILNITRIDNIEKIYSIIVQIDKASWKDKRGISIYDKKYKNFFQALLRNLSNTDNIFIGLAQIDDKTIAYDIIFKFAHVAIDLKTSYDSNYRNYGVGNIVSFYNIKKIYELGYKEFHLLWGNIKAKSVWKPEIEQYDEVFIFNNRLKSKFLNFLYHKLLLYRIFRFINYKLFN